MRRRGSRSAQPLGSNVLVRWRVYPWIVISCGVASVLLLWRAYVFDSTILVKCGGIPITWLLVNCLPGLISVTLWVFCTRHSMCRAGTIVSIGTVLISAYAMFRASDPSRGSGDMGCILLFPDGVFVSMLVAVGSLLAWLAARINETQPVVPKMPPNASLERTRQR